MMNEGQPEEIGDHLDEQIVSETHQFELELNQDAGLTNTENYTLEQETRQGGPSVSQPRLGGTSDRLDENFQLVADDDDDENYDQQKAKPVNSEKNEHDKAQKEEDNLNSES